MQPHFRLSICSVNLSLTVYCELTSLKSASVTGTRLNLGDRFGWSREEQLGCFAWQRAQRASAPKAVCPWGGARTQPQGCTGAWLHPFPSWVSSCSICPLELREGRGGWSCPGAPTGSCLVPALDVVGSSWGVAGYLSSVLLHLEHPRTTPPPPIQGVTARTWSVFFFFFN